MIEEGYYWLRRKLGDVEIGEWRSFGDGDGWWYTCGSDIPIMQHEEQPEVISDRLKPPG